MTELESIVPSLKWCEKIGHLFPNSSLVWAECAHGDFEIALFERVMRVDAGSYEVCSAPTPTEMCLIKKHGMIVTRRNSQYVLWDQINQKICQGSMEHRHEPNAWAELIYWQMKEGLLK